MYGITETTVHVSFLALTEEMSTQARSSVIGRPLPGLRTYVLDERLHPVPVASKVRSTLPENKSRRDTSVRRPSVPHASLRIRSVKVGCTAPETWPSGTVQVCSSTRAVPTSRSSSVDSVSNSARSRLLSPRVTVLLM